MVTTAHVVSFSGETLVEHIVNFAVLSGKCCVQVDAFIDSHPITSRQYLHIEIRGFDIL